MGASYDILLIWKKKFYKQIPPWDFEGGLGTIEPNWVCPENRFANKSTGCGAI